MSDISDILKELGTISASLTDLQNRMGSMESRMGSLESRMGSLESKVEERGRETRPMWEQALKEIMDSRLEMNQRFDKVESEVQSIASQMHILSSRDLRQDGDLLVLKNRLDRLENDPNAPTTRLP